MNFSLILGGSKGLGNALGVESSVRGINPIMCGRSVREAIRIPQRFEDAAISLRLDLTKQETFEMAYDFSRDLDVKYLFWVAGNFHRGPLDEMSEEKMDAMIDTHLRGPLMFLRRFHRQQKEKGLPYHLVTIASSSSWRLRHDEDVYCALKAAKAHFTRNFSRRLAADLPGSRTLLVNPGGLKTELFSGTDTDTSKFMDPRAVARIIWHRVMHQGSKLEEVNILRNTDGSPDVTFGPRSPEA